MSLRNATANWSGYNHQGKIGLLVALRKMDAIKCLNLNQYRLELETQEDAKIVHDRSVIEVHQVKAYLNSKTIGAYTSALDAFEACLGKNYLHTICEITNWDDLTDAQNTSKVERYPYSDLKNYCELDEIDSYIVSAIQAILTEQNHAEKDNIGWSHVVFQEYLALLDERIRSEHQNADKAIYNVGFGFEEIYHIIISPPTRRNAIVCAIRREIYICYVEFIKDLEEGQFPSMSHTHEVFVNGVVKQIALLDDNKLEQFLNQIFPASTQGRTLGTCTLTDKFFNAKDFSTTFLYTLICNPPLVRTVVL